MTGYNIWWWVGGILVLVLLAWWLIGSAPTLQNRGADATETATTTQSGSISGATTNGNIQDIPSANRSGSSVLSIAENLQGASTFASWLRSTGVAAEITGKGPYTILVPTNGSISQLPAGTFTGLSAAERVRFVEYHIIKGKAIDANAMVAGVETAMSGDAINFNYGTNKIPMVGSAIIIAEYKGSNGIVYLVDNVLIPPQKAQ